LNPPHVVCDRDYCLGTSADADTFYKVLYLLNVLKGNLEDYVFEKYFKRIMKLSCKASQAKFSNTIRKLNYRAPFNFVYRSLFPQVFFKMGQKCG